MKAFLREFSHEMTFLNKANCEFDNITEHSFLVSNRDFDFCANDSMIIKFNYDERRSILPINFADKNQDKNSISPFNYNERKESKILKSPL